MSFSGTPRFSQHWLGIAAHQIVEETAEIPDDPIPQAPIRRLSVSEAQQGIREQREHRYDVVDCEDGRQLFRSRYVQKRPPGYGPWSFSVYRVWNSQSVLSARLSLAPVVHSVMHSKHLQHAFKNALGVGLLSLPVFYPAGSPSEQRP